jgi:trehalose 6-phosphate synthase
LKIHDLNELANKLRNYKIIVVSNREPYIHNYDQDAIKIEKPAGGVVTALDPLLQADIDAVWIAWGSGSADPVTVDEQNRVKVPPEDPKYFLKRVWLHEDLINGYYYGFSNKTLWPLCHNSYISPKFQEGDWFTYIHANELFTKNVVEELDVTKKNIVFINDYQVSLVASNLRNYCRTHPKIDLEMIMFWHIPWPSWEVFRIMPWKKDILENMLNLKVFGLQTQNDVFNFLRTVQQEYEDYKINFEEGIIEKPDNTRTLVKSFPISIDYDEFYELSNSKHSLEMAKEIQKKFKNLFIILSVDRLDYIKGLRHRQLAIKKFFEMYPEYIQKIIFIQIVSPSRSEISTYAELDQEIKGHVKKINIRFQKIDLDGENESIIWKPIEYIDETLSRDELFGYYKAAGAILVSSIQDGMNLVIKEAIASGKDNLGVLLSRWAGASSQLKEAIRFNPYNVNEFSESIKKMLELSDETKKHNMSVMRSKIQNYNIYDWIIDIFNNLLNFLEK